MSAQSRAVLKAWFETGDTPTEAQFADLIDSFLDYSDDGNPFVFYNASDLGDSDVSDPFYDISTDADTTEKDLAVKSIPASFWVANGCGLYVKGVFHFANNANAKTIRAYFGATQVNFAATSNGLTAAGGGLEYIVETFLYKRDDTKAYVFNRNSEASDGSFTAGKKLHASYSDSFDLTIANDFKLTGQNGVASANDIVRNVFLVQKV